MEIAAEAFSLWETLLRQLSALFSGCPQLVGELEEQLRIKLAKDRMRCCFFPSARPDPNPKFFCERLLVCGAGRTLNIEYISE